MSDRTVTLSDGSVWTLDCDAPLWIWLDSDGDAHLRPFLLDRDGMRRALTAADHRAIADVLEPAGKEREGEPWLWEVYDARRENAPNVREAGSTIRLTRESAEHYASCNPAFKVRPLYRHPAPHHGGPQCQVRR